MFKKILIPAFAACFLFNSIFVAAQQQESSTEQIFRLKYKLDNFKNPSQWRGRFGLLQFSPDGKLLATSGVFHNINIYNTETGELKTTLSGDKNGFNAFSFNPDGSKTAIAQDMDYSEIRIFDLETGKLLKEIDGTGNSAANKKILNNSMKGLAGLEMFEAPITPNWTTVLIQRNEGEYELVDVATNTVKYTLKHSEKSSRFRDFMKLLFVPFPGILVPNASFSADGKHVVVANGNNTPTLWLTATGAQIARLEPQEDRVYQAIFSPDGQLVATFNIDGVAKIWDTETGKILASFGSKKEPIYGGAWDVSAQKFATISYKIKLASLEFEKDTPVWNARDGKVLYRLENANAGGIFFSPDGKLVATDERENKNIMARIWNAETGALLATLPRNKDEDRALNFVWNPDGKYLAAASSKEVKIWNVEGKFIQTLENAVFPARFSRNGKLLATGGKNDVGYVWQMTDN